MTFKSKLILAFGVMTVPLAIIGGQVLWNAREQTVALKRLDVSLARSRVFADIESTTYRKVRKIRDYLSGQDPAAKDGFSELDAQSREKLTIWRAETLNLDDLRRVDEFSERDMEIVELAARSFALFDSGKRDEALRLVQQDLNGRLLPELDATIKAVYASSRTHNIQRAFAEAEATARSTRLVLLVIIGVSVVFSAVFSFATARSLARPIERLSATMDRVAEGDFRPALGVSVRSNDEVGDLTRAFVRMAERLDAAQEALRHQVVTLRETQSQLIQSEKLASLGQMAAAVAHGLRNPLASIRAATQLALRRTSAEAPMREQLSDVIDAVDRLERRIVHLLDFARPAALSRAPTSVPALVRGALGVFEDKIASQGVSLELEMGTLPEALVDPAQIEQALIELIANALEAMPGGGALVVAGRPRPNDGGGAIEITIRDTGDGVAKDALGHLAEPFFTTKADGTGLGLAIAKRFVEENEGRFAISSTERQGTSVTLILPVFTPGLESAEWHASRS